MSNKETLEDPARQQAREKWEERFFNFPATKSKDRQHVKERFEERVFNIRLKTTQQELNLGNNSHFVKIIEQEYATKYLESLGIEPTQRNIVAILKKYPLKNCEITAGWNNSGLYADTITIVARHKTGKKEKPQEKVEVSDDMIQQLDLKKMNLQNLQPTEKKQPNHSTTEGSQQPNIQQDEVHQAKDLTEDEESKIKFKLNYNLEVIKQKYLFPFNQTFQRRMNINMRNADKQELPQIIQGVYDPTSSDHDKFLIFESKVFGFPFLHIEVQPALLRDLQRPPSIMPADIEKLLRQIVKLFPNEIFPLKPKEPEKKKKSKFALDNHQGNKEEVVHKNPIDELNKKSRFIIFEQKDLQNMQNMLQSQEMIKFIGIFLHFSYWLVFGLTQPIQIEALTKKQMFIQMFEIVEYFSSKAHNQKLWMQLYFPMILLSLKMSVEYFYKNHYPTFFEQNHIETNTPGQVAMDKLFYLVERVFDQNNLFCRFTFLESDFKTKTISKGTANDRKFMQKRIFGISPFIDLLISNPQDGRSRAILAKQHDIDIRENVLNIADTQQQRAQSQPPKSNKMITGNKALEEKAAIEKSQKQKMFNIMLNRMDQDIEGVLGKKSLLTFKHQ